MGPFFERSQRKFCTVSAAFFEKKLAGMENLFAGILRTGLPFI
ncbi:hypothetical protein B4098_0322 [Heyndrickxia coagulans]|uniref:Uncharacterized protein n=1 Tax=Heyndrickxia coagulans TaxID=1398 RepID=A0A150JUL2_HEYCO|nr:hypothetical protein B4098_0322 [Heyndrickxia coagulans]